MKYNIINLLFAFLFCLSVVVCQEDFYTCKRVCDEDFVPKVEILSDKQDRAIKDLESLLPFWTTCQYRCHRCYLLGAIKSMDDLQKMFDNEKHSGSTGNTITMKVYDAIKHSLHWTCYNPWLDAIKNNNSTSKF